MGPMKSRVFPGIAPSILDAIGGTPLIRLNALSDHLDCEILAKAEQMNPGGSVKDRIARAIVLEAEASGRLRPGGTIVEASAGNTGIGLALVGRARGYKVVITVPEGQTAEKIRFLETLCTRIVMAPDVRYTDERHFYHLARRIADETPGAYLSAQFDNLANRKAHYDTTGPEIWAQTGGQVDALVASAGTGGTISGTGQFLKERNPAIRIVLADPLGSALYSYIKRGVLESDGDTIAEGIGIGRIVPNFADAPIDDALQVTDQALVEMAYHLLKTEGLWVGTSAALNVWACASVAREMGPGHTLVTILCDGGERYTSRLYDAGWLAEKGLTPSSEGFDFLD